MLYKCVTSSLWSIYGQPLICRFECDEEDLNLLQNARKTVMIQNPLLSAVTKAVTNEELAKHYRRIGEHRPLPIWLRIYCFLALLPLTVLVCLY